ncbi:hypothetical protein HYFRA_00013022 [Hymenoscyphus fraxineus]|uniref:Hypersensitive response-inducing protein n=1 Tax=Hymenoscyphus fraxineus TaxID=746836 RepID=A0A9N9L6X3_9HELO|nr:hypothetical protein HYFRA_00013022 [Hymenoscyphus fraxineus]
MKFTIATVAALASVAAASVVNKRQELTHNFEFQGFAASCAADSDICTFSFNLFGAQPCSATQPAFTGTDANGATYKKLPNIGQTYCGTLAWNAARGADGVFKISASDRGRTPALTGAFDIPAAEFTVANGVEAYTGAGIIILYG